MATDELALLGARVSATIELSISPQWNIPIPVTEALSSFFSMYIQVWFSAHTLCTETDVRLFALFMAANASFNVI